MRETLASIARSYAVNTSMVQPAVGLRGRQLRRPYKEKKQREQHAQHRHERHYQPQVLNPHVESVLRRPTCSLI